MAIARAPITRDDGVAGEFVEMDNGDGVVRLRCPHCGAAHIQRWIGMHPDAIAQDLVETISQWHGGGCDPAQGAA